ncbi:MAG: hypothetical protein JSS82_19895 [Bacteroidetes bacterium]|nr:hypothetical protein [Bacteroidota bacterium]
MITILLEGGGNNWLAIVLLMVALAIVLKGGRVLIQSMKRKRHRKHMLSGMHYDGIMDEFINRERK